MEDQELKENGDYDILTRFGPPLKNYHYKNLDEIFFGFSVGFGFGFGFSFGKNGPVGQDIIFGFGFKKSRGYGGPPDSLLNKLYSLLMVRQLKTNYSLFFTSLILNEYNRLL